MASKKSWNGIVRRLDAAVASPKATLRQQIRAACQFEPLESRTMMSVSHLPLPATVHAQAKSSVLAIPSSLNATVKGPTTIQLVWTDKDATASGYNMLRSADGINFSQVGRTTSFKTCTFTDTSAASDATYKYEIQAYNTASTSEVSAVATAITPLVAPASLTVTAVNTSSVQLAWTDKDSSAGGYNVLRSDNGKIFTQIASLTVGDATTYLDTTALSGRNYKYEVQAYSGSNTSAMSNIATATTPLAAPSRLEAAALSSSSVQLIWADNDSSATGYYVLRSTDNIHFSQINKITIGSATTYTDKSVQPRHTYSYEIQAFDSVTTSPGSTMASASTPLAIPTAVTAVAKGATTVQVSWTDTDPAATGYYVLRSSDGTNFSQIAQISSGKTTSFTDIAATSNSAYRYKVQAYCTGNTSAMSDSTAVTTPLATPTSLTAAAQNGASMQLNWTDNDAGATGYLVLRATDGKTFLQIASLGSGSAHSYTDNTVTSGKAYQYEVQAIRAGNNSAISAPASATTPLAAPSGLAVVPQSSTIMQLNWTDNDAGATGYLVLRSSDGINYSQIAKLTSGAAVACTDSSALSLHAYTYEVEAISAAVTSAASNVAGATTPLAVPTGLAATVKGPATIQLGWTDKDAAALGYYVLRSGDGISFTQIAQLNSGATTTYTDTTASSNHGYTYKVRAFNGSVSSDASASASATTPLIAPSALAAAPSGANVQLNWTDNDLSAGGYLVFRATDAVHFTQLAKITSGAVNTYTDSTVVSGKGYQYELQAFADTNTSAMTSPASVTTPLAAPSGLTAAATTGSSVQLAWTDNDASATGYYVMRSTDGTHFSQVTKLTTAAANSYTDATVASMQTYSYEIEAFDASVTSANSNVATVTTALNAPTGLTAASVGAWINLAWTSKDAQATGFVILRSGDGTTFTQLTKLNSITTTTYCDMTATAGQTYYYKVQAVTDTAASPASNVVNIVASSGSSNGNITIATRYTNELVITASGTQDSISLFQSGSTLTITADGQTYTQAVPAAGVFVYTRGGADGISVDGSVLIRTTIEAIDGAVTAITSAATNVSAWIDSTDTFSGLGAVHAVSSFAGGVSKALAASLSNPTDAGATVKVTQSLWGTGPVAADVNQGGVGDCYFLSTLAAYAGVKPSVLQESAVDMGDGTYTVRLISQGTPVYVRVSNSFSTGFYGGGFQFAHPGASGDIWAMVMEKAFAYFRTGANTYSSINSGWMGSVYTNLGIASSIFYMSSYSSESAFYNMVSTDLASGEAVTFGTVNPQTLIASHAYTLVSVSMDGNGVTHYVVRNPWGISGDSLENSQGYATLTFAQMKANFYDGCQATS